jgi:ABC-type glycerol-3-phosphate transport system substrate-binding protein
MIEVWELSLSSQGNLMKIEDTHLAECLQNYILVVGSIDTSGKYLPITESISIHLQGEISTERSMDVWLSWEGIDELKNEIERFASMHDVDIHMLEVPKISSKLIQTHRGGGAVPDMIMVQSDYVEKLVQSDTIQSLAYFDTQKYNRDGVDSFNLFGVQWAIPFYYDTQILIGNRNIFSKVGLDTNSITTLESLEIAAGEIKDYSEQQHQSITPMSWNIYSAYWFLPFQLGFGKERLVEPDGTVSVADTPSVNAMDYLLSLIDSSLVSVQERDAMLSQFVSGNTGIIMTASYMIPELEKLDVPYFIIPLPLNQKTDSYITPISDYKGLAIPKRSRNPILARRLIQYLTGLGVQHRFTSSVHKLPAITVVKELDWQDSAMRRLVKKSALHARPIPPDRAYSIYKNTMWSMIRLILDEKFSSIEGLREADRLINVQISEYVRQLPESYRNYYEKSKGDDDEREKNSTHGEQAHDNASTHNNGGFFTWLRNLW